MWLGHAAVIDMPPSRMALRSSSKPLTTGRLEMPPPVLKLTPGTSPSSLAASGEPALRAAIVAAGTGV